MKKLSEKFEEVLSRYSKDYRIADEDIADMTRAFQEAVKERDSEVFGWLYKENPDPKKLPETESEIEAANNEKARIAQRMEETI